MMSTPSSSARRPPQSPQVTAEVLKFRCLYTHDLRRKAKRWHDGNLRYHKHNKRVMVYDDQGNFVGDHHWRSSDEVQDGDEMELDKGVLIEVCENVGTTETDITNLYEKKRSSQGSPQNRELGSQVVRPSTATSTPRYGGSSQSFRSLNDLLGIKKTPVNPLASPYEQRNSAQAVPRTVEQRAPKRQKTSMPNQPTESPRAQSQIIDLTEPASGGNSTKKVNPVVKQITRNSETPIVAASASHQQRPALSKPAHPKRPNPPVATQHSIPASSEVNSSPSLPENGPRPATRLVPPPRPLNSASTPAPPAHTRGPPETYPTPSSTTPSRKEISESIGTTRVGEQPHGCESRPQNAPRNPPRPQRPVPPLSRSSIPATSNVSITGSSSDGAMPAEAPRPQETLSLNQPAVGCESQVQDAQPPTQPQRRPPVPISSLTTSDTSPSRPLTRRPSPAVSNSVQPTENVPGPSNMPPPSRSLSARSSETPSGTLRMGTGKPRRKLMYSALLPGASRAPLEKTPSSLPASKEKEPIAEPKESELVFTCYLSSNDEFMPSSSTQFIFDQMLDGSGVKPPSNALNGRRSVDSPLRKSLSDPTTLVGGQHRTKTSVNVQPIIEEPKEQGPWTSEALDLFDFWPAGRPKPNERNEDT
ncbi:unnamed protein product [Penicillium salamii]|uniref:5'-3' DNA helicase ZGRF1-like N-terminal domain-containing protein n=1 Tax=Penicillium salamii TaxID=1612424 RepID=A0A9W4NSJ7_9EURO|nr:unnamed protein product [Penicillium salamii]CAG8047742.1 unnamed protein product [Penicillium salamii]CAG8147675.1 unnamed protein product [Penicillium salamii]CAG8318046.1 unnamed protein product [Penicillium salamii]CAG8356146.1 unnamed protein product [Penicillium salamii]